MIPTVFITRHWSRTRIHEGQIYIRNNIDNQKEYVTIFCRADSNYYSRYASFIGDRDIGEMLFGKKTYGKKFYGPFIGTQQTEYRVIYMDDARVCPFCGRVHVSLDYKDGDKRNKQWDYLSRSSDHDCLSDGELATYEAIAKLNEKTPEFLFRMCDECRKNIRHSKFSINPPDHSYAQSKWFSPYEKLAESIKDKKDRVAWWETMLICHRKKLAAPSPPCVKKAIERRLRRKNLTEYEHMALSLMLAASSIKKLLKTA